jgi:hypothetical protein
MKSNRVINNSLLLDYFFMKKVLSLYESEFEAIVIGAHSPRIKGSRKTIVFFLMQQ